MLDKIDPEVKELLELLDSLTEDQLATAHLLLAYYAQIQYVDVTKKKHTIHLEAYLKRVTTFLKETRIRCDTLFLSYYATLATNAFSYMLQETFKAEQPSKTVYNGFTLLRIIKSILGNYHNTFGDRTFKELFDDVSFLGSHVFSRKASTLLMQALYEEEAKNGDKEQKKRDAQIKNLLDHYRENWNTLIPHYESLSAENLLLFHGVSLILCRNCLDLKHFTKYRTHIGKAIKRYIESSGNKIKKVSLQYLMDIGYPKLKEAVFGLIEEGYKEENGLAHRYEWFNLANDRFLADVDKLSSEDAHQILMELQRDKDDIFTSPKLEEYAQIYLNAGREEFEKLFTEAGKGRKSKQNKRSSSTSEAKQTRKTKGQKEDPETTLMEKGISINVQDEQMEGSLKESSKLLKKLDISHKLMLHSLVVGILLERNVSQEMHQTYKQSVNQAISLYKHKEETSLVEAEIKKTDREFKKIIRTLNKLLRGDELRKQPYKLLHQLITANAISQSLEDMSHINQETVGRLLSELEYHGKVATYKSEALQAYFLKYLIRAEKVVKEKFILCPSKCEDN